MLGSEGDGKRNSQSRALAARRLPPQPPSSNVHRPDVVRQGWGRVVNITMNHDTMRRAGFSPYGPSKAALESETVIWAQDLAGTGVTVNGLLPGDATDTGMIPEGVPDAVRRQLLRPEVMVEPLLWLASDEAAAITGSRLNAARWDTALPAQRSRTPAGPTRLGTEGVHRDGIVQSRVSRAARRKASSTGVQSSSSPPRARWNSGCHCSPITNGARW